MSERVALVTGSARGIGRAIALRLAKDGYDLVINNYHDQEGPEVTKEIEALGREAIFAVADVSSTEQVKEMVKRTVEHFGRIDLLVNNAGIAHDNLLIKMPDEEWEQTLAINLSGAFRCSREVLRHMIKQRSGRIISISSVVGLFGNSGQAHYAASKAGIVGLTKTIAKEYGRRGITANAVAPGYIDTKMTAGLPETIKKEIYGRIALGRIGTPEEVAGVVSFLASPDAAYINGQVIAVDGCLN